MDSLHKADMVQERGRVRARRIQDRRIWREPSCLNFFKFGLNNTHIRYNVYNMYFILYSKYKNKGYVWRGINTIQRSKEVPGQRTPFLKFLDPPKRVTEVKKDPSVEIVDFFFLCINTRFEDDNDTIFSLLSYIVLKKVLSRRVTNQSCHSPSFASINLQKYVYVAILNAYIMSICAKKWEGGRSNID